jgi:hypothetical protein
MAQFSDSGTPGGMATSEREDWGDDEGTRETGGTRGASPELEERGGPREVEGAFACSLAAPTRGGTLGTGGEAARRRSQAPHSPRGPQSGSAGEDVGGTVGEEEGRRRAEETPPQDGEKREGLSVRGEELGGTEFFALGGGLGGGGRRGGGGGGGGGGRARRTWSAAIARAAKSSTRT